MENNYKDLNKEELILLLESRDREIVDARNSLIHITDIQQDKIVELSDDKIKLAFEKAQLLEENNRLKEEKTKLIIKEKRLIESYNIVIESNLKDYNDLREKHKFDLKNILTDFNKINIANKKLVDEIKYLKEENKLLKQEIEKKKNEIIKLEKEANEDALTGILNTRGLNKKAEYINADSCSIVTIDVNDFKGINDTYGHPMGDKALQFVAKTINDNIRPGDLCFRIGGDEFLIILRRCPEDISVKKCEQIQSVIANTSEKELGFPVKLSFGVAYKSEDALFENILQDSDSALYLSKKSKNISNNLITVYNKNKEEKTIDTNDIDNIVKEKVKTNNTNK